MAFKLFNVSGTVHQALCFPYNNNNNNKYLISALDAQGEGIDGEQLHIFHFRHRRKCELNSTDAFQWTVLSRFRYASVPFPSQSLLPARQARLSGWFVGRTICGYKWFKNSIQAPPVQSTISLRSTFKVCTTGIYLQNTMKNSHTLELKNTKSLSITLRVVKQSKMECKIDL